MQNSVVETLIGAAVLAVAAMFLVFAYGSNGNTVAEGYEIAARFSRVDGVNPGTDVRMSGIKIGTVSRLDLDPKTYAAVAYMSLRDDIRLPDDSSVRITSEGLLGGNYLSVEAGGSQTMLAAGGEIENTQGAIDLIGLLGKAVFGAGAGAGDTPAP